MTGGGTGLGAGASSLSPGQLREIALRKEAGESWDVIERALGRTCRDAWLRAKANGALARALAGGEDTPAPETPPTRQETVTETGRETVIESAASARIRTLDDLLAACEVDLSAWTVDRFVVNKWETAAASNDGAGGMTVQELFQVKAWLKPAHALATATAVLDAMRADMIAHAPRYAPIRYNRPRDGERHMLEVCLFDVHIGMLAWAQEAGADYDVTIASDVIADAVDRLVANASGWPVDRVLVPLGNDWMHTDATIDGKGGATTRGTPQDVDTRWQRQFRMARTAAVGAIDTLRQVAPVDVVIVPGNHDSERMFTLGEVLEAWYRADDAVTIRNSPAPRDYYRYGSTLLGLAHGHNEKHADLPLIMATEAADDWAATTHREWHIGHRHRKGEAIPVAEHSAVRVRTMPSLAPADAWHAAKGYHHMRAAEAYIWNHDDGYVGHLSVNAKGGAV